MKRWWLLAAVGCFGFACAPQVKITKRDGCWVKQTESFPKTVREEVGPCMRPDPKWSNDRVARLVQECMAEADYRWQTQALAAWSKGDALPPQQSEQTVMDACMTHASTALVQENEALKHRVAELGNEREELKRIAQQERDHLRATEDRMTDALGEAAKKPAPAAFATANSNGTASTQTDQTAQTAENPVPNNTTITLPTMQLAPPVQLQNNPPAVKQPQSSCAGQTGQKGKGGAVSCSLPPSKLAEKEPTLPAPGNR